MNRKRKKSTENPKKSEKKTSLGTRKGREKQLEQFKKERELQMQLHKIIKIQSLFRGAIIRKHKIRHIKESYKAVNLVVDSLITNYINTNFIPDILLELVTLNRITETFDLYSPQTQVLIQIRNNLITNVVKSQTRDICKQILALFVD